MAYIQCKLQLITTTKYLVNVFSSEHREDDAIFSVKLSDIITAHQILDNLVYNIVYFGGSKVKKTNNSVVFYIEAPHNHIVDNVVNDVELITFNCMEYMQYCKLA